MRRNKSSLLVAAILMVVLAEKSQCATLSLAVIKVTPHLQSDEMRYRKKPDFSLGARTQLFIQNMSDSRLSLGPDADIRLRRRAPTELLDADTWAWYDFPDAWKDQPLTLAPKAVTVWTFNGTREEWGVGKSADVSIRLPESKSTWHVLLPQEWNSNLETFLGDGTIPPEELRARAYHAWASRIT